MRFKSGKMLVNSAEFAFALLALLFWSFMIKVFNMILKHKPCYNGATAQLSLTIPHYGMAYMTVL